MKWEEISRVEFHSIIEEKGGIKKLHVYGVHTSVDEEPPHSREDIYTEWGDGNSEEPIVSERRYGRGDNERWVFKKNIDGLMPESLTEKGNE